MCVCVCVKGGGVGEQAERVLDIAADAEQIDVIVQECVDSR